MGSQWLKILVLGVVYFFGIKDGIGAEGLSEFFEAVHLNHHVGTSASSLRKLKQKMRDAIEAYGAAQSEHCQPHEGHGICVGGDETFFGLPILVLLELASGYIFTKVECDNRTYHQALHTITKSVHPFNLMGAALLSDTEIKVLGR